MAKRLNPDEMMEDVKGRLTAKYWAISFTLDSWFSPGDLGDGQFKYKCKKLYELGLLERGGDENNRWGYWYHIPNQGQ